MYHVPIKAPDCHPNHLDEELTASRDRIFCRMGMIWSCCKVAWPTGDIPFQCNTG